MKGIGYQGYRSLRILEGIDPGSIEKPGRERYSIYWGRSHLVDHETGVLARGKMKFGRGKFTTAIQRGRNEGGADFRIYAEIIVETEIATYDFERMVAQTLSDFHSPGAQGQQELYDIKDVDLEGIVRSSAEYLDRKSSHWIREVNMYQSDTPILMQFDRSVGKKHFMDDPLEGLLVFS